MPFRAAKRLTRMSTVARRCRIYPISPFATCHFKSQPLDPITPLATFVRHKFVAQENKVIQLGGRQESGGGGKIILWARHAHIDQVTGWLSDKQTGSPMLIMQICRPNWFAAEEAAGKVGGYHSQLCQQDGKQNAAYAQFRPTTKFTAKYMQISGRYIEGKRQKAYATQTI